ncbi:MAG TPA: hypothetical protein VNF04_12235 [Stellaceae bacterium]|nr:hypothetical protein [Stellaceae bacterium]
MAVYRVLRPAFIGGALRQPGEIVHHMPGGLDVMADPPANAAPHQLREMTYQPAILERIDNPRSG